MGLEHFQDHYETDQETQNAKEDLTVANKKDVKYSDAEGAEQQEKLYAVQETKQHLENFRAEEFSNDLMYGNHYDATGELRGEYENENGLAT